MRIPVWLTALASWGLFVNPTWAAEKAWHEGTIVAMERQERTTTIKHFDTEYSSDDKGKAKAETRATTSEVPVDVYMAFTITDGQKTYVARQGNTIWHSKLKAQPGDKVEFAVDGDALYVRHSDDKEVKWKVLKSSLVSARPDGQ